MKNKGIRAKGAATRLIAKAIEGSEDERKLVRLVRQLALNRVMRGIEKVVLPSTMGATTKRHFFAIPFGQRGMPMVTISTTKRNQRCATCQLPHMPIPTRQWATRVVRDADEIGILGPMVNIWRGQRTEGYRRGGVAKQVGVMTQESGGGDIQKWSCKLLRTTQYSTGYKCIGA